MKVKVAQPFQVCHDGTIYRPGELAEVPDQVARAWLASGWVQPVDEHQAAEHQAAEGKPAPAPRTSSSSSSRRR